MSGASARRVLVLGGARSGKSTFAERLAGEGPPPVLYVATATAGDAEMAERIRLHQARRPAEWRTVAAPLGVGPDGLRAAGTVLYEDLTLLLSNLMARRDRAAAERAAQDEVDALVGASAAGLVIIVSNEVGLGIVPVTPLGREFRDALGRVNQYAAAACSEAHLLVAGLPLRLK